MKLRTRHPRKLLSASLGVAAVSYVACGGSTDNEPNPVIPTSVEGGVTSTTRVVPSDNGAAVVSNPFNVVANLPDAGTNGVADALSEVTDDSPDSP